MATFRFASRAVAALIFACSFSAAHAVLIVDTGEPYSPASGAALQGSGEGRVHQFLAGMFTLSESYSISSVATHLQFFDPYWVSAGTFNFKLYENGAGLPGNLLYASSKMMLTAGAAGAWHTAEGLNWAVTPGTYWISVEAEESSIGVLASSAGKPLEWVAVSAGYGAPGNWQSNHGGAPSLAGSPSIRIDAVSAVPEPATFGVMALGLAALGLRRSQYRRRQG